MNSGEDSFTVQCDEPATAQSEEPATAQSEEPAVTQSKELARAPEPIPEFLPSQPHASSDSGSQLEVCFVLLDSSCEYGEHNQPNTECRVHVLSGRALCNACDIINLNVTRYSFKQIVELQ